MIPMINFAHSSLYTFVAMLSKPSHRQGVLFAPPLGTSVLLEFHPLFPCPCYLIHLATTITNHQVFVFIQVGFSTCYTLLTRGCLSPSSSPIKYIKQVRLSVSRRTWLLFVLNIQDFVLLHLNVHQTYWRSYTASSLYYWLFLKAASRVGYHYTNGKMIDDDTYNCQSTRFSEFPTRMREMRMPCYVPLLSYDPRWITLSYEQRGPSPLSNTDAYISSRTGMLAGFCISAHLGREMSQQHKKTTCQNDLKKPE